MKAIKKMTTDIHPFKIKWQIFSSADYQKKHSNDSHGCCIYDLDKIIHIDLRAPTTKEIIVHELTHAFIFKNMGHTPIHRQIDFEELICHMVMTNIDDMVKIRDQVWYRFKNVK